MFLTCNKLPLDKFINCTCDGDLSSLIVSGSASDETLQTTWEKIYTEYSELIQSDNYSEMVNVYRKIGIIKAKINFVNCAVAHLELEYNEEVAKYIYSLGISIKLIPGPDYELNLSRILKRAKKWLIDLASLHVDWDRIQKTNEGSGVSGYEYFDGTLNALSQHHGYRVRANDITVSQFCRMLNELTKQNAKAKKK